MAANTWTTLTPFADNIGDGGGRVYASGAIYVLRGGGQTTSGATTSPPTPGPTLRPARVILTTAAPSRSTARHIYALPGVRRRRLLALQHRRRRLDSHLDGLRPTPAAVDWGGALTLFLATGNISTPPPPPRPTLVSGVSQVVLRMTVSPRAPLTTSRPIAPTYTATNGVTATFGGARWSAPMTTSAARAIR